MKIFKGCLIGISLLFLSNSCKQNTHGIVETGNSLSNLLIVLSDQHSYDMLEAYGNSQLITPHLDQFAREGVRFTSAFSNQPVCTPFRGMLMSGLHPLKNGAFYNDTPLLKNQSKLLGEVLKEQGYQTAYIGKWHLLGGDRNRPIPKDMSYGFDSILTINCHTDYRPGKAFFWNVNNEKEFFEEWEVYGQTRQALNFLDTRDPTKPFALIVSWHPPHDWGKIKGEDGKMHYRYDTMEEFMALYEKEDIILRPGLEETPDRKTMDHGYMAMITGIDKVFGMLMSKLKEKQLEENTLTIFTADHGDMLESFNANLPKQYPYDYSNRIPLLIKYPKKIKAGSTSSLLTGTLDLMPTIFGLLQIESSQTYDGKDLSSAIINGDNNAVDFVPIWNFTRSRNASYNWRGTITKKYPFAISPGKDRTVTNVLFDREKDPNQLNNLFEDPAYESLKDSLSKITYHWMATYEDKFYGAEEFKAAEPPETWGYNLTERPLDLLKCIEKE